MQDSRLRRLWQRLRGGRLTRRRAAGSVAVGLFIGSLPLFGAHFPLCVATCVPLGLDVITAYIAANISNPLVAPFLVTAEIQVGSLVLTGRFAGFDLERARAMGVSGFVSQAAIGSVIVGAGLALLGAFVTSLVVRRDEAEQRFESALARTTARYARARPADRFYVAVKLRSDPVVEKLAALSGPFGSVLDLATGRGQLGLLLRELGASALLGLDWDEAKIETARSAGGDDAAFESCDLRRRELPLADTVLLIDVLHYLEPEAQDALLARAAGAVRDGGRLVVREVDTRRGWRAWLTRTAEKIGTRTRVNRGNELAFRSPDDIAERLRQLGFRVRIESGSEGTPLANAFIVAERPRAAQA